MKLFAPTDVNVCIPFSLAAAVQGSTYRIGGLAPKGVLPLHLRDGLFLGTLPLCEDSVSAASLFIAADSWALPFGGQVFDRGSGPIEVCLHDPAVALSDSAPPSPLSEVAIVLEPIAADRCQSPDGEDSLRGRHKLGGRPSIFRDPQLEDEARRLEADGFRQLVQLDVPGFGDALPSGNWPFGDGMFHLLGDRALSRILYFWEN